MVTRASRFAESARNFAPRGSFAHFFKVVFRSGLLFWLEVVLSCRFWIEVLAEKALRKMSVRVKLKNLTTDIIQMGFNHIVPLIQVHFDTQKSKNGSQVRYMYVKKCRKIAHITAFFDIHISHLGPIFLLLSVKMNLNKWYNMIKTHLNNICSQIFEFYPDRHFSQCFFT